jgi:hypothetical protein
MAAAMNMTNRISEVAAAIATLETVDSLNHLHFRARLVEHGVVIDSRVRGARRCRFVQAAAGERERAVGAECGENVFAGQRR